MAIGAYIDKHHDDRKPFIWTAKAADILEKLSALARPWIIGILGDALH
jgi:hypothetical protein